MAKKQKLQEDDEEEPTPLLDSAAARLVKTGPRYQKLEPLCFSSFANSDSKLYAI